MLFRLLSWPYFRTHKLRTTLTIAGIVLGVALFVAMHSATGSVLASFSTTVDRIAGKTELEVTAGETGFGEDVLEIVQTASSVRVAVPVIEATIDSTVAGQGSLLVLGIDMTGDRSLRDYAFESADEAIVDDPLVFLAQPDSLILTGEFAERHGIAVGARVPFVTAEGEKSFTVRGILQSSGLTSGFGGQFAVMDIYAAQKMFGRGRTFDRIDVGVQPGSSLADCERELRALLGPGFEIQPPSSRGQQFEALLAGYSLMMTLSSAFALFIGMFIIYNAFAIAVTQRRTEIGVLRALGATRRQIQHLFLTEGVVVGVIGSAVGLGLGVALAWLVASTVSGLLTDVYRVAHNADGLEANPMLLGLAFILGLAASLLAAIVPAREAARVDPVHAIAKGRSHVWSAHSSRIRAGLAAAGGFIALGCLALGESRVVFYVGYLALLTAALLAAPFLSLWLTRSLRPLLKWVRPVEGALAADSLIQAPRRTAASVAALMFSLGIVVAFEGMARANRNSIVDWVDTALNPDLFVTPSAGLETRTIRFPLAMGAELAALDGVEQVQVLRNSRIPFRGTSAMLLAMEMDSISQTVYREPVAGDVNEMYRQAAAGQGLVVSDNLAELHQLELGDEIEIAAPYGEIRLPVAGIIVDYTDQLGSILIDHSVFVRYWHDDTVNMFRVYLKPGVDPSDMRRPILELYAGRRQVFVMTNADLKNYVAGVVNQWFGLTTVQIAVAVLVAVLGITNTLTVSITDRRREFGILQAVGGLRSQIRRTIWLEALTLGVVGLLLGLLLGALNLYYVLEIVHRDINGMRFEYVFPVVTSLILVPTVLGAALGAALWPAESVVRGSLVEALEYE